MPIMLKCKEWPGESKVKGFTDYIEFTSFNFGVGRAIKAARGTSTREAGIASVSEITLTKETDKSSVKLFEMALVGKMNHSVDIAFTRQGSDQSEPYIKLKLEGCGISGFSVSSGGDRPTESITLNFDKVEFGYNPVGDDLTGTYSGYTYDLAAAAKS